MECVKCNPCVLEFIPDKLITYDMCLVAINKEAEINKNLKNYEESVIIPLIPERLRHLFPDHMKN